MRAATLFILLMTSGVFIYSVESADEKQKKIRSKLSSIKIGGRSTEEWGSTSESADKKQKESLSKLSCIRVGGRSTESEGSTCGSPSVKKLLRAMSLNRRSKTLQESSAGGDGPPSRSLTLGGDGPSSGTLVRYNDVSHSGYPLDHLPGHRKISSYKSFPGSSDILPHDTLPGSLPSVDEIHKVFVTTFRGCQFSGDLRQVPEDENLYLGSTYGEIEEYPSLRPGWMSNEHTYFDDYEIYIEFPFNERYEAKNLIRRHSTEHGECGAGHKPEEITVELRNRVFKTGGFREYSVHKYHPPPMNYEQRGRIYFGRKNTNSVFYADIAPAGFIS